MVMCAGQYVDINNGRRVRKFRGISRINGGPVAFPTSGVRADANGSPGDQSPAQVLDGGDEEDFE